MDRQYSAAGGTDARAWLQPSQALQRFAPTEPVRIQQPGAGRERLRYGFRIGSYSFLTPLGTGSEVLPWSPPAALPNSPSWLLGVVNLRGALVPVFDLADVLGARQEGGGSGPGGQDAKPMLLVLDKGDQAAALMIDGYPRPLRGLRAAPQVPSLPDVLRVHVASAWADDTAIWLELGHAGLLLDLARNAGRSGV